MDFELLEYRDLRFSFLELSLLQLEGLFGESVSRELGDFRV